VLKLARVLVVALSSVTVLVVLPSLASAETCPNAQYRVGPSANLPDCRAYEQVTPVEKEGGLFSKTAMGPGSEGTLNVVVNSFAGIDGIRDDNGDEGALYSIERTALGWVTSPLPPPASEYQTTFLAGGITTYLGESLDGRLALWQGRRAGQPENRADFWVSGPGGVVEDVGPLTPPDTPDDELHEITNLEGLSIKPVGESADFSHILYQTAPDSGKGFHFWPFDETRETPDSEKKDFYAEKVEDLYEFVGRNSTAPMLVGVDNEGKLISDCGTELGAGDLIAPATVYAPLAFHNAISYDGETVFFTSAACGSAPAANELFARVGNGMPGAHTVAISEPSASDCAACNTSAVSGHPAFFQGASVDGSKVFFVTQQPLLGGDESVNIYEYDFDAPPGEKVIRVSGGDATVSDPTAEVQGIVQTSQDGSHVYFVARGILTKNPNAQGQIARAGANNLYMFERDAQYPSGRTVFIADLSQGDQELWTAVNHVAGTEVVLSNITRDGRFLVFTSTTEHLTPDDASTAAQVFEYDAETGNLTRVSIGQNGYNDNGNTSTAEASIPTPHYYESSDPVTYSTYMTVSADGSYVFFQSTDGLTPQALNRAVIGEEKVGAKVAKVYAENVYEYHDGSVYLISDGRDLSEVFDASAVHLLGTDESGVDVFFSTVDLLAPSDIDSNMDIYDARVDGGFPAPAVKQRCAGDECQGVLSTAPVLLAPGSEFQAGGNPPLAPPAPVAKPKVKKAKKSEKAKRRTGKAGGRAKRAVRKRGRVHGGGGRS
jgi:hypothetical protein